MKKRTVKGSALIWAISILAVLAIIIMTSVTVSMSYAASASRETGKTQAYYSAKSAAKLILTQICDGSTYTVGTTENALLGALPSGRKIKLDTEDIFPSGMGEIKASFEMTDATTGWLTVSCTLENIGTETVYAKINKTLRPTPADYGIVARNLTTPLTGITVNSGKIFLTDPIKSTLSGAITTTNASDILLPSSSQNISWDAYKDLGFTAYETTNMPNVTVSGINLPRSEPIGLKTKNDVIEDNEFYYSIGSTGLILNLLLDPSQTDKYFFEVDKENRVEISFSTTEASDEDVDNTVDVYLYLESKDKSVKNPTTVTINSLPENVRLFVSVDQYDEHINTKLVINDVAAVNGMIYCEDVTFNSGTIFTSVPPSDTTIFNIADVDAAESDDAEEYQLKFVKYADAIED